MIHNEANDALDRLFGGEENRSPIRFADEISDRALQLARRRVDRRGTPRVIQALPMPVHEATTRPSCLPSFIVGGLVLGLAFLDSIVPVVAGALAAVLP